MGSALPVSAGGRAEDTPVTPLEGISNLVCFLKALAGSSQGGQNYPDTGVLTLLQALLECGLKEWKNCTENYFHILQVCEGPCAVVLSSGPGCGRQTAGHSRGGLREHTGKSADPEEVAHANIQVSYLIQQRWPTPTYRLVSWSNSGGPCLHTSKLTDPAEVAYTNIQASQLIQQRLLTPTYRQVSWSSRGCLRQHTGKSADPAEVAHANIQASQLIQERWPTPTYRQVSWSRRGGPRQHTGKSVDP